MPLSALVTFRRHCGHSFLSDSHVAMHVLQNWCVQCRTHKFLSLIRSWHMLHVIWISCDVVIFKPGFGLLTGFDCVVDVVCGWKKLGGRSV